MISGTAVMSASRDQEEAEVPQPLAQSLIKFTHCERDIYSSSVPQNCPICGQNTVSSWDLENAPVSLPCPFVNAHGDKCSFVLKPTRGLFIGEYDGGDDLHVGITSSKGIVYHFNETGIHKDNMGWEQCVSVPLVPPDQYALIYQWDSYLEAFSSTERWLSHRYVSSIDTDVSLGNSCLKTSFFCRYAEQDHNCYTFALRFVNDLLLLQGKKTFTKEEFTKRFVLPRTQRASKYITLCHEVSENYFYIVPHSRK